MKNRYLVCIAACLTLGLAPFTPQPHLLEKIRWLAAGTPPLRPIDWFDVALHGTPWLVLLIMCLYDLSRIIRKPPVGEP